MRRPFVLQKQVFNEALEAAAVDDRLTRWSFAGARVQVEGLLTICSWVCVRVWEGIIDEIADGATGASLGGNLLKWQVGPVY